MKSINRLIFSDNGVLFRNNVDSVSRDAEEEVSRLI